MNALVHWDCAEAFRTFKKLSKKNTNKFRPKVQKTTFACCYLNWIISFLVWRNGKNNVCCFVDLWLMFLDRFDQKLKSTMTLEKMHLLLWTCSGMRSCLGKTLLCWRNQFVFGNKIHFFSNFYKERKIKANFVSCKGRLWKFHQRMFFPEVRNTIF